jgi:hypothetical protein
MVLALATSTIVLGALASMLALPRVGPVLSRTLGETDGWRVPVEDYDPGRDRRAERRARALLRSCVAEEDWEMYRELGFLRVHGSSGQDSCEYLVYPHRPILAFLSGTDTVLGEYCVGFPDRTRPYGSDRLPDSDDVLAKWIALTTDERSLIDAANVHLPGRQIRLAQARRDIERLRRWERERRATRPPTVARQ